MSGISFRELEPNYRYNLLCGVVEPRPIAQVTTQEEKGKVNAAPFSFFNRSSPRIPDLVVLGMQHKAYLSPKDTTRNFHRSGQFVVHMVDEALAATMNDCAVDFPSGEQVVGGDGARRRIAVDRCRCPAVGGCSLSRSSAGNHVALAFGPGRELLVGEVLRLHARVKA